MTKANDYDPEFSSDEFHELSNALEQYHGVFYRFWSLTRPSFSKAIKTAAVYFNKTGECVDFKVNYEFWQRQNFTQKLFIISHECQHVTSNHGFRSRHMDRSTEANRSRINIAMDICVNESMVSKYGFIREEIDPENRYIWADKIAAELGIPYLEPDKSFEHYYNLLGGLPDDSPFLKSDANPTVDDHDESEPLGDVGSGEMIDYIVGEMSPAEAADFEKNIRDELSKMERDGVMPDGGGPAGTGALGFTFKLGNSIKVKEKKKWETVIKRWAMKTAAEADRDTEQWARTARRFAMMPGDIFLPYEMEVQETTQEKSKIELWFFLDTSGSCIHLKGRFFKAALSLPTKKFDVRLFCFDDKVYPTTLASRTVKGGGGTSFAVIERYVRQHTIAKGKGYPDGIFVITDGDGDKMKPFKPDVWNWFLSTSRSHLVPAGCHIHKLAAYE